MAARLSQQESWEKVSCIRCFTPLNEVKKDFDLIPITDEVSQVSSNLFLFHIAEEILFGLKANSGPYVTMIAWSINVDKAIQCFTTKKSSSKSRDTEVECILIDEEINTCENYSTILTKAKKKDKKCLESATYDATGNFVFRKISFLHDSACFEDLEISDDEQPIAWIRRLPGAPSQISIKPS